MGITPQTLLDELGGERSSWIDVAHYPDTLTLRRMLRLADFAAENPARWRVIRLAYECPELSYAEIGVILGISQATVCRHLAPVNLALPEDYPAETEY